MKNEGRYIEKVLHTKLNNGLWPNISQILEKIHFFLPRIPKVTVQLFKDNHAHIQESDDEHEVSFKDYKVTLKTTYSSTAS